jgi:quercetin dioxygenase-like cupin family protein
VKVVPDGERTPYPAGAAGSRFTGAVELEMLHATPIDEQPDIALVHFHDGAVTRWHVHPGGQHLFVHEGSARVGTEADGEVPLEPGALVVTPPGERHWHGAAAGRDAAVLAITWGTTQWEDEAPQA